METITVSHLVIFLSSAVAGLAFISMFFRKNAFDPAGKVLNFVKNVVLN